MYAKGRGGKMSDNKTYEDKIQNKVEREYDRNFLNEEKAKEYLDAYNEGSLYYHYAYSPLADSFSDEKKHELKTLLYKLKHEDLKVISRNKSDDALDSVFDYSLVYMIKMYFDDDFPFGYQEREYLRHKRIMNRRLKDVKERVLIPPNFNDNSSFGISEMIEYQKNRKWGDNKLKPRVKGKTLLLFDFPNMEEEQNSTSLIRYTFLNKFENVEIPAKYMIKYDYKRKKMISAGSFLASLHSLYTRHSGYSGVDKFYSKYEIICFNLFLFPVRDKHIEVFMNFLISFQSHHPDIYIKDVSGKGYNAYQKYSFYEKLKNSLIDVSVIK
jgi:hypothetical protein